MRLARAWRIGLTGMFDAKSWQSRVANVGRLNVARLANVPSSVLEVAAVKSKELEEEVQEKKLGNM